MQKATDLNSTQRFGRAHPACQLQPDMNNSQRAPTGRRPYAQFPEGHKDSSHRRRCALAAREEYYRLPIVRVPHPQLTNAATIASSFRRPLALVNERCATMLRRISTVAWAAAAWDPRMGATETSARERSPASPAASTGRKQRSFHRDPMRCRTCAIVSALPTERKNGSPNRAGYEPPPMRRSMP